MKVLSRGFANHQLRAGVTISFAGKRRYVSHMSVDEIEAILGYDFKVLYKGKFYAVHKA